MFKNLVVSFFRLPRDSVSLNPSASSKMLGIRNTPKRQKGTIRICVKIVVLSYEFRWECLFMQAKLMTEGTD